MMRLGTAWMIRIALASAALVGCGDDGSSAGGTGGENQGGASAGGGEQGGASAGGNGQGGAGGGSGTQSMGDTLYELLTGHFDSTEQASTNPAYYPIDLRTCPIAIPELGARVLHVEQAVIDNGQVGAPYRQRVYVVTDGADPATQAVSAVWEFTSPGPFSGFCDGEGMQATPADLVERAGCRVEVDWKGDHFEGSTPGKECLSDFQGATYATSEVKIYPDRIESWDRGYDASDAQVWGATAGPYVFRRVLGP